MHAWSLNRHSLPIGQLACNTGRTYRGALVGWTWVVPSCLSLSSSQHLRNQGALIWENEVHVSAGWDSRCMAGRLCDSEKRADSAPIDHCSRATATAVTHRVCERALRRFAQSRHACTRLGSVTWPRRKAERERDGPTDRVWRPMTVMWVCHFLSSKQTMTSRKKNTQHHSMTRTLPHSGT
jgi:hypothetical protein